MPTLNQAQTIAAKAYSNGDHSHIIESKDELDAALSKLGDPLFLFLIKEFDEKNDCDSLEEAARRARSIARMVEEVAEAIEEAL